VDPLTLTIILSLFNPYINITSQSSLQTPFLLLSIFLFVVYTVNLPVVQPWSYRVIYYFDTPTLVRGQQLLGRVNIIMHYVSTTSFSVAINGDLHGFFPWKCGVRQGDPLSPYLFICCMEYFSRMLKVPSRQPRFCYHPKCGPHGINHLVFADDVLLLSHGDRISIHIMFHQLDIFGQTSGLAINASKSSIFFEGVSDSLKQVILYDTGFKEGNFPFANLRVPLSPHRLLASQFPPLLHKLESSF